jgi:hypothetical protein
MKPQIYQPTEPARALPSTTTAADAVKETAVAVLRTSIDRILAMMRDCDEPGRKTRLNATLFVATRELAAIIRSQSGLSADS